MISIYLHNIKVVSVYSYIDIIHVFLTFLIVNIFRLLRNITDLKMIEV